MKLFVEKEENKLKRTPAPLLFMKGRGIEMSETIFYFTAYSDIPEWYFRSDDILTGQPVPEILFQG